MSHSDMDITVTTPFPQLHPEFSGRAMAKTALYNILCRYLLHVKLTSMNAVSGIFAHNFLKEDYMKGRKYSALLLIVVVLLFSMACSMVQSGLAGLGGDKEPGQTEPVSELIESITSDDRLGDTYESLEGGFSFKEVVGYEVVEFFGFVSMSPPGTNELTGPTISLIGGENDGGRTAEEMVAELETGLPAGVTLSKPANIRVSGIQGQSVDIEGVNEGFDVAGMAVMVAVSDTQMFSMIAIFPAEEYGRDEKSLLEALLDTVQFFEPQEVEWDWDEEEWDSDDWDSDEDDWDWESDWDWNDEGLESGDALSQWAVSATASSEYGSTSWSASQATSAPDTPGCGDYGSSWASATSYGQDWIELDYSVPVIPESIHIYQTYSPNQVVWVEVRGLDGLYTTVYFEGPQEEECPFLLSIPVTDVDFLVDGVKIYLDQDVLEISWNEIDAVRLIGNP